MSIERTKSKSIPEDLTPADSPLSQKSSSELGSSKGASNSQAGSFSQVDNLTRKPLREKAVNALEAATDLAFIRTKVSTKIPAWQVASDSWYYKFNQNLDSIAHLSPGIYDYSFGKIGNWFKTFNAIVSARLKSQDFNADKFDTTIKAWLQKVLPPSAYRPSTPQFQLDNLMQWMDEQGKAWTQATANLSNREQKILQGTYYEWQLSLRGQLITYGLA